MQNHHSLVYREEEREMFPTLKVGISIKRFHYHESHFCIPITQLFGVGAIPWSPLARGLLTRPLNDLKATSRGQTDP